MSNTTPTARLPVLPLKDTVIYPDNKATPVSVGRDASISAINYALYSNESPHVLLLTQRNEDTDNPEAEDLYDVGVVAEITRVTDIDGGKQIILVPKVRAEIKDIIYNKENGFIEADFNYKEHIIDDIPSDKAVPGMAQLNATLKDRLTTFISQNVPKPESIIENINTIEHPEELAYYAARFLREEIKEKQKWLEADSGMELCTGVLNSLNGMLVGAEIKETVKEEMQEDQKEYLLRKQKAAIEKELGEDGKDELEELEKQLEEKPLSEEAFKEVTNELKKLKRMQPQSAEYSVALKYVETLLGLPWGMKEELTNDLTEAKEALDEEHYGLEKVKDKVIKSLAVQNRLKRKNEEAKKNGNDTEIKARPKVICLVGPPGVGKTSIAESLAKAQGRKYIRMALGGLRDEAELRGHRRTYVGAEPGRIIKNLIKAETTNPLFVLDEIDKLSKDFKGNPADALLEVLDPAQNNSFQDNYLNIDFDLSDVMFVCTANVWNEIPAPLQDRMDTTFLGSYTEDEKFEIAKRHLIPKIMKQNALEEGELSINDDAIRDLIRYYTKESGVRQLQREIENICEDTIDKIDLQDKSSVNVTSDNLEETSGPKKYTYSLADQEDALGVVTGLAYTSVGGETLKIEAAKWEENGGNVKYTGKLGDVMQESIQVAEGLLKSHAEEFDLSLDDIMKHKFHVHVPEGATPKDGPSAGAAMLTAIFSVASGKKVRKDVAMTGELTLSGKVTAIGGLREKLSAASREGYTTVLIPKENEKDLEDVPQQVLDNIEVVPVSTFNEVLNSAIVGGFDQKVPANDQNKREMNMPHTLTPGSGPNTPKYAND
jgi:ATP-dependent Lon protease